MHFLVLSRYPENHTVLILFSFITDLKACHIMQIFMESQQYKNCHFSFGLIINRSDDKAEQPAKSIQNQSREIRNSNIFIRLPSFPSLEVVVSRLTLKGNIGFSEIPGSRFIKQEQIYIKLKLTKLFSKRLYTFVRTHTI